MINLKENWNKVLDIIEKQVTAVTFDLWVKALSPYTVCDDVIILYSSSVSAKNQCEKNFKPQLKLALDEVFKNQYSGFKIITDEEKAMYSENVEEGDDNEENIAIEPEMPTYNRINLNPKYTFNNFVVGKSNQVVYAASRSVAENPSNRFNPLFIYGGVGLGKTHLLHAIGNFIAKNFPNKKIMYVTCEQFANDYIDAIRSSVKENAISSFRDKYRNVDVLLMDDIQFISKKTETQENFFHTFNDLYQNNKQIVIASDRPPKDIETLSDRLRSRFASGLIQDIQSPDFETRVAILTKKAQIENYNVESEVIDYLADRFDTNVRELEGYLGKVVFYANLLGHHFAGMQDAYAALQDIEKEDKENLDIEKIIRVCCEYFNISREDLIGKKKSKEIVEPRQICMYVITEFLDTPLVAIGDYFGGRDHTTVMHARDKVARNLKTDEKLKTQVNDLKDRIKGNIKRG